MNKVYPSLDGMCYWKADLPDAYVRIFAEQELYPDYAAVTVFFTEMAEGILGVQGKNGLWHQILDDFSTYAEASSTSMFICAFSRGIRLGIFDEKLCYKCILSIQKAWTGMKQTVINRKGDLYGVCQGSGCSFSCSYYQQLGWRFNDPHGIGIAILAGTEKLMLDEFLRDNETNIL